MDVTIPELEAPHALRILIVEDYPDGRESLRLLLEILGHDVEVATNGADGVAKALEMRPDVVLIDIGLPLADGYQVASRLRAELGRDVLLLAQTAYGSDEARARGRAAGFDGWLVKPVDLAELSAWLTYAGRAEPASRGTAL